MHDNIDRLFSGLSHSIDNRSLSTDAIKEKFLQLSRLLDGIFSEHLKRLAPLLKNKFDQADRERLIIKQRLLSVTRIRTLEGEAWRMAEENLLSATQGLPPKYKEEEIRSKNLESDKLKQSQSSDGMTWDMVVGSLANVNTLANKYYRLPRQDIRRAQLWLRYSKLMVIGAKVFFFFATILSANVFSSFLKSSFGIEGLFSEILVASIFLVTVDTLFDDATEWIFWRRYQRSYRKFHAAYLNVCAAESDFLEYVKLAEGKEL